MKASRIKIAQVVGEACTNQSPNPKFIKEVAAYLLITKREKELSSIMRDVIIYRAERGVVEANVISAFPISEKVKTDIKLKIKKLYPRAKAIVMTDQINKSVVSGIKVELPNKFIDLTVETKLNRFKQLTTQGKGY